MARRGIPLSPGYRPGSHWAKCDQCDNIFRASELRETWDHFWVCDEDWEARHPQDFLRVRPEVITVEDPVRPEDCTNLIDLHTITMQDACAGVAIAGCARAGFSDTRPAGTFNNQI